MRKVIVLFLLLLFSTCVFGDWITPDPVTETTSLLNDLVDNPGLLRHTESVDFKSYDVLPASLLAEKLPISSDQICISKGDFHNNTAFELSQPDNSRLTYNGTLDQPVIIGGVCGVNLGSIKEQLKGSAYEGFADNCNVDSSAGKYCLVWLEEAPPEPIQIFTPQLIMALLALGLIIFFVWYARLKNLKIIMMAYGVLMGLSLLLALPFVSVALLPLMLFALFIPHFWLPLLFFIALVLVRFKYKQNPNKLKLISALIFISQILVSIVLFSIMLTAM